MSGMVLNTAINEKRFWLLLTDKLSFEYIAKAVA